MTETFHEFVVHRSPALSRRAYLLTGDHQLAEDLLQSALAKPTATGAGSAAATRRRTCAG